MLGTATVVLTGCLGVETTPEKSAAKAAKAANTVAHQKGVTVGKANASIKVEDAVVVQDPNGVAAVVRVKNTGPTQASLPVGITVTDARGRKLYANDVPGLDPSLTSLPVLAAGEEVDWVNNQILVAGRAAKVAAVVGAAKGNAPGALPKIALAGIAAGQDEDGFYAKGTIRNESSVAQQRIVITCVARDGDRVTAAGRAVIDRLEPAKDLKKPTTFTVFFIGDPKQARLACAAPPTVLEEGGAK
ncbi:hypothetical protein DSM104299_01602 [Baekduia alba]|uniref:hypothetical protein n=1 Tax=Baekduia alba TaxID=2997333 RepID=UPI002341463A|nr:hypothetical protein [Baekduia alba]WCB92902.1 hypothetical protein DSM104299_01602 [Baekduia alba]